MMREESEADMPEINDKDRDRDMEMEEDTQSNKYLTFVVGNENYGIPIYYVTEIIGIQAITAVPELPHYVRGIINLRGKIISVMDVRLRFKKEEREYNDRTCIIVINIEDLSIGLIVDSVSEVINIPERDMEEPPHINREYNNRYVQYIGKVGNDIKLILNCNKLIDEEDKELLENQI